MIRLIALIVITGLGVWAGMSLSQEPGRIFIEFGSKAIEMSVWVGAALLVGAVVLLYFGVRLVAGFIGLPTWFKGVLRRQRQKKAQQKTNIGLLELAEGHWRQAEKNLIYGAKDAEVPLLNYLAAARAAQEQNDDQKRDEYLALAHDATNNTDMAVGLTQAELQYTHGQYEQSLATLKQLRDIAPRHPSILKLLKNIYLQLSDWENLLALLPLLKKQDVLDHEQASHLEQMAFERLIAQVDAKAQLDELWDRMPKNLRLNAEVAGLCAHAWIRFEDYEKADTTLKAAIKKTWSEPLVELLGNFKNPNPAKSLAMAQGWLKEHPKSCALYLTCARLAAQDEKWEQAQKYLETCISIEPRADAYAVLGLIYEKLDKPVLSAQCFRKGMLKSAMPLNQPLLSHEEKDEHVD